MIKEKEALSVGEITDGKQFASAVILTDESQLENELSSLKIYVVQSDVTVTKPITIAKNVTLIFQGGRLVGNGTITGDKTKIVAGPIQIFGENLTVNGKWCIDRAYPQWFDSKVGTDTWAIQAVDENKKSSIAYNDNPYDCSVAINKAIKMKQAGEVFLPSGVYFICNPINMVDGSQLIGDGYTNTPFIAGDKYDKHDPIYNDLRGFGTEIVPFKKFDASNKVFVDGFSKKIGDITVTLPIVAINLNVEDLGSPIPDSDNLVNELAAKIIGSSCTGCIKYIYFNNNWRTRVQEGGDIDYSKNYIIQGQLAEKVCCQVAYSCIFEHVKWKGFRRAVKWMENYYADMKAVVRCIASSHGSSCIGYIEDLFSENPPTEPAYQFDLSGLGDALIFDGNHVTGGNVLTQYSDRKHIEVNYKRHEMFRALRIHKCHGGSITNNILNNSVDISKVTGMEFANNHLELRGASLTIKQSNITVRDNFFEKNSKPCIIIDSGMRSHIPDDAKPEEQYTEYSTDNNIVTLSNNNFVLMNHDGRTPAWELSEYDIIIDAVGHMPTNLKFRNNYRTVSNKDGMSFQTVGINIGLIKLDSSIVPFESFNDHSYILSYEGSVIRRLKLIESTRISDIGNPYIIPMQNKYIPNGGQMRGDIEQTPENDNFNELNHVLKTVYKYDAQVILDKQRMIALSPFPIIVKGENNEYTDCFRYMSNNGILFAVNWSNHNSQCVLRIVRTKQINESSGGIVCDTANSCYVDIPMCGNKQLYDNMINVNGYAWKAVDSQTDPFIPESINPDSIEFINDNVKCMCKKLPSPHNWKPGDIVFVYTTNDLKSYIDLSSYILRVDARKNDKDETEYINDWKQLR